MSHGGSEFEQVVELVFQNVQYLLTVALAPGDTLCVEAEHKTDGSRWRGDFTSRCESSSSSLHHQLVSFSVVVTITSLCKDWDDFEKRFSQPQCTSCPWFSNERWSLQHAMFSSSTECTPNSWTPYTSNTLYKPPLLLCRYRRNHTQDRQFQDVYCVCEDAAVSYPAGVRFSVRRPSYVPGLGDAEEQVRSQSHQKIIVHFFPTFLPCSAHEMCSCDLNIAFHLSYVIYFQ
jgi:hypothetical protein